MRSVFDEEEEESARERADTELTLGSGTLLAIFLGLLLLCGFCFGLGYTVGRRGSSPTALTAPRPAPDQEPLQPNGSIPKPSAFMQTPITPAPAASTASPAAGAGTTPNALSAAPSASSSPTAASSAPQVHPALSASSAPAAPSSAPAPAVRPALAQQPFLVQVAAVSNAEDANVLVNALRQRNYPVTAHRDPGDNFIHVRIGPFATRNLAEQWKNKLLNDGYNAVVQP